MTVSSSDILDKKVIAELSNGSNISNFLIEYVNDKSYGSFRTFSKKLKEIIEKLEEDGLLEPKDVKKINEAVELKKKNREPEIVFPLEDFIEDYKATFEIRKNDKDDLVNMLILLMPFLYIKTFLACLELKFSDIELIDFENCLVCKIKGQGKKATNIKIAHLNSQWKYLFEYHKKSSNSEFIFHNIPQLHTIFSVQLEKYLQKYTTKRTSRTKYITIVKNALKFSKYDLVSIF